MAISNSWNDPGYLAVNCCDWFTSLLAGHLCRRPGRPPLRPCEIWRARWGSNSPHRRRQTGRVPAWASAAAGSRRQSRPRPSDSRCRRARLRRSQRQDCAVFFRRRRWSGERPRLGRLHRVRGTRVIRAARPGGGGARPGRTPRASCPWPPASPGWRRARTRGRSTCRDLGRGEPGGITDCDERCSPPRVNVVFWGLPCRRGFRRTRRPEVGLACGRRGWWGRSETESRDSLRDCNHHSLKE